MNKHMTVPVLVSAMMLSMAAMAHASITIRVFASDAVERPLREIGYAFERQHPNVKLHYEFAASGLFMGSIIQGVPPDIYISSTEKYQDQLINRAQINFPTTLAYDYFAAAEPCSNPVSRSKLGTITPAKLFGALTRNDVTVGIASPTLSPAGRYTHTLFMSINKKEPGAYAKIMSHSKEELSPNFVMPYVRDGKVDIAILYSSQIAGMRRQGVCVNETQIPRPYNRKMTFSASLLKASALRVVSPIRKKTGLEYVRFLTSKEGTSAFRKWGFIPANNGG